MQRNNKVIFVQNLNVSLYIFSTQNYNLLLALCTWWGSVALVNSVPDTGAQSLVAVCWQQSPRLSQEAKVVV